MKALMLLALVLALSQASAQQKLTRYFPAGQSNAEILIDNYLKPMGEDISVLPNNGWYTTAKTHKQWGFDVNITVNSVFVNNDDKFFDFPSGLSGINYLNTDKGSSQVPTAYGDESENPQFQNTAGQNSGIQFRGADGFEPGKEYVFSAQAIYTLQAGIGLFKNTDLRFRFTPKTSIVTVEVGNWGVGLMHDLTQHFGGGEKLFALSVFLGYTKMDGTVDLSGAYTGSGQEAAVTTSGFTGQLIISKAIKIISFYGALGYDNGKTTIDINGTYNVTTYTDLNGDPMLLSSPFTLSDPYSYEYDASGLRFTAGTRLKLGPVTLNGDYSFVGDKKVLTVGFGFTVH